MRTCRLGDPKGSYTGVLRRDVECEEFRYDEHFTFVETVPPTAGKRNPHIFSGLYISVTRRDDGSLRLNFKELKVGQISASSAMPSECITSFAWHSVAW